MPLTDAWLKNAHRKRREGVVEKADRDGLSARATPAGKVVFQIRYRYQGKAARLDLGSYPAMSLKDAREEALKRRGQLEQGHDPRVLKRVEQATIVTADTNESLFRLWYDGYCIKNKKGAPEILRSFEIHVFPTLGALPADSTGLAEWMDMLERVAQTAPRVAERILANQKQVHKWGVRRGRIENQPLAPISAQYDLQVNRHREKGRALSDEELQVIWHAKLRSRMPLRSKLFIQLALIYGARPGELIHARREEFTFAGEGESFGIWELPPERHKTGKKTGKSLVRPIIPEVEPLLRQAMSLSHNPEMLFSGETSDNALNDRSVLSFPYNVMRVARRQLGVELRHWSMYDLRKTARTNWSTLAEPHVCEIMLGHRLPGEWQRYDRHHYLDEQAAAYRTWWQRLMQLVAEPLPTA